ncbi:hypothetical protein [Nocardia caishijiensis]|uniref:Uncharacterized protein n=1 Tax=Nocardia caishijiensis TaxID=184756 RepID=A0ABQ6YIW4_9NOCA|nr:hypothetical protein [Nocardia caishijiensis]KAF0845739.1 hypothetical protein FNL39_106127 [Nocardia caishijiensis]
MYSIVAAIIATAVLCSPGPRNIGGFEPVYIGPFESEAACEEKSLETGIRIPYDENGKPGLALIPECVLRPDSKWYLKT